MRLSTYLMTAALVGVVGVGQACTTKAADDTKQETGAALDATKSGADKTIDAAKAASDATKDAAAQMADRAKAVVDQVADKPADAASATGAAVTDGWITRTVQAHVADEPLLKGSTITVDTRNHEVTLKGTVSSNAAKARAAVIARGIDGVTRVDNQLVVK